MNNAKKLSILEAWFGIDKVLFGEDAKKAISKQELYEEYMVTKGGFLTNLYEIWNAAGYSPKGKGQRDLHDVERNSISLAESALTRSTKIIKSDSAMRGIKEEIKESSFSDGYEPKDIAPYIVKKNQKATALDLLTIAEALQKGNSEFAKDWNGSVLVEAHKTIRDRLVDISFR